MYLANTLDEQDETLGLFLSGVMLIRIHSFVSPKMITLWKLKKLVCSINYLQPKGEHRYVPFPAPLVRSERQTVSGRIWTRVTDSISYNDIHYTKCVSTKLVRLVDPIGAIDSGLVSHTSDLALILKKSEEFSEC